MLLILLAVAVGVGMVALVQPRLAEQRAVVAGLSRVAEDTRAGVEVVRAIERLRGLARQVRHAPVGEPGEAARRQAWEQMRALGADAGLRAGLSEGQTQALDEALALVSRLATRRADAAPTAILIAQRLERLSRFAALGPDDAAATPRSRLVARLLAVLQDAAESYGAGRVFLTARARQIAIEAVAAPGLPAGLGPALGRDGGWAALSAIEAALSVPALRARQVAEMKAANGLWARADRSLSEAASGGRSGLTGPLLEASGTADMVADRLRSALLAALFAAAAVLAAGLALVWGGLVAPLLALAREARRLAPQGSGRGDALAHLAALVEAADQRTADAEALRTDRQAVAADAETLRAALLGAATEAASGRTLASGLLGLDQGLGRARLLGAELLNEFSGGAVSESAEAAGARLEDGFARLAERLDGLRVLCGGGPAKTGRDHLAVPLASHLGALVDALDSRLRARGVLLSMSCDEGLGVIVDPALLTAVLFYALEAAALRAEVRTEAEAPAVALSLDAMPTGRGGVVLGLDDDGPPLGASARRALEPLITGQRDHPDAVGALAETLREAPECAALLLADGLCRAAVGDGMTLIEGEDGGLRVRFTVPEGRHA